jgi:small subunit ribosomal protein S20
LFISIFFIDKQNNNKESKALANHKSAEKRARQNEIRRIRNKAVRTRVKGVVKEIRLAAAEKSDDAVQRLDNAKAVIAKAAKKGVIHRKTASRKISRLTRAINAAS